MRVKNLVPNVYYSESRDFSYIGRIFEVVFNYMKTTSDLVGVNLNNDNIDSNLLELLTRTLGFETKHKYITKDLIYITSSFIELMRNKGTKDAIEQACRIILTSQGIKPNDNVSMVTIDTSSMKCTLALPEDMKDVILLEDLMDYLLPSGFVYEIERYSSVSEATTVVLFNDSDVTNNKYSDDRLGLIASTENDLSIEDIQSGTRSTTYSGMIVGADTD